MQQLFLHQQWHFKQRDTAHTITDDFASTQGWLPGSVPGTVHQDLLAAGQIPDPFLGLNEKDVQWVGESEWLYRSTFDVSSELLANDHVDLCFDGLDTYATVWLNGECISVSENMFVPLRISVKKLLRAKDNQLQILFESALKRGQALAAEHGKRAAWNGDTSRVYVRKAQYHYGWDWGPTLMTAGVWRAAYLEGYSARISELACPIAVADDLSRVTLSVHVEVSITPANSTLSLKLYNPDDTLLAQTEVAVVGTSADYTFAVDAPQLWYPVGYGAQPLYRLEAALKLGDTLLDQQEQRIGLRKLRVVQEAIAGEEGTSFYFEVNNIAIFSGGANWIPADLFIPRISTEKYREWLQLTVDANMVMLRVWGGGIYEEDVFYDLCDEMGILVWQDFMFACGMYPAHPQFQQSVRAEAEANVRRLRHHPSIALWCGNNEDYQIAQSVSAYEPKFNGDFTTSSFPARQLYERLLPEVCEQLDPTRLYWRGSPYGGADVFDNSIGDRHTWDVWHGKAAPYQDYGKYEGRFVSEFGMQAYPAPQTLADYQHDGKIDKRALLHHNKADIGEKRLKKYVSRNMPKTKTFDDYAFASQLMQAEALAAAYRIFRRRWQNEGARAVGGALVWQINDCWQVTSWAIVDSLMYTKPAYYTIKRALAPLTIEASKTKKGVDVWAASSITSPVAAVAQLRVWALNGELVQTVDQPVTVLSNQTTPIPFAGKLAKDQVLEVRLVVDGKVIARTALWNEPLKSNKLVDPQVSVKLLGEDRVEVSSRAPAKGVWLTTNERMTWSDNCLDVFPDDAQVMDACGLGSAQVESKSLFSLI